MTTGTIRLRALVVLSALVAMLMPSVARALPVTTGTNAAPTNNEGTTNVWGDLYPAFTGDIVVTQPEGSTFKDQLNNAEVGGTMEHDGYTVTKRADGWWVYASGLDGRQVLETPARVGLDAVPAGVAPQVGRSSNVWLDSTD